ncbi:serine/threonine-protein kinase-like protein At3g51990 [Diospyros lotus]|uniref:serine/threonine-protein kinase-like protein At3g51990 n=1 Tax=Diospyros lotus TaxID=55363 RepID=UPI002256C0C4|nr:serine/threonine-protein kinase-like protein At3g51990 [Diospyros lotus]
MGYLSCNAESAVAVCDPHFARKRNNNKPNHKAPFETREFSFSDLDSATDGFSENSFLGKGSHGSVYKAVLDDGKLFAAVKRTYGNCTNSPAENEIEVLSRVRSPRLVNLLGFGVDSEERKLIVVEFMPNGSLYDLIHATPRPPGWARRIRFALQVARAVQHLHLCNPPVIHRDIKSSNVLIDREWNARLGDFGLALRGHVEDVKVRCTPPAGTLGYLDPGYLAPGDISAKSDVFSFGILLLEIVSGRNAIDVNYSPPSVVEWAAPLIRAGEYSGICDPRIGPPPDPAVTRRLAVLAAKCVRSAAEKRPEMSEIEESLRALKKRVSSLTCNSVGRRVGRRLCQSSPAAKYEPLDESAEVMVTGRGGSRRNRKVSSVSGVQSGSEDGGWSSKEKVGRSKSVGSGGEMKPVGGSDFWSVGLGGGMMKKKGGIGLGVKMMPAAMLRKSRSMGMLQSSNLGRSSSSNNNNNGGVGVGGGGLNLMMVQQLLRNPNNKVGEEMKEEEDTKLLVAFQN